MAPQIAVSHWRTVASEPFDEFRRAVASPEVEVEVIAIDPPGPMAGVEWLMPTAVVGFIASSYFGGMLKELGKDHYVLLKERFNKLFPDVAGPDSPNLTLVGTTGKVKEVQPYSLYFSLVGEVQDGLRIKLLLRRPIDQSEYERSVEAFFSLIEACNTGTLNSESKRRFQAVRPLGRTILVVFNEQTNEVIPIDPRTGALIN